MKNLIRAISLCLVFIAPFYNAGAYSILEDVYVKAGAGAMYFQKFKATETADASGYEKKAPKRICPIINIGAGYKISNEIRADINLQYTKIKYKTSNLRQGIRSMSAFVNGYYDFILHDQIVPYLTVGIGIGANKAGDLEEAFFKQRKGKSKTNLIWNIGAGVQYLFNECFSIDFWYRYIDLGTIKTDGTSALSLGGKQKLKGHQVLGSLIYNF